MPNPNQPQGTLNRLVGSVLIPNFPELNVTPEFLGDEGISIAFQGETTTMINTMTGQVTSPEPYQPVAVTVHLLKTQFLSGLYKDKIEADARVGDVVVRVDTRAFPPYQFFNCAIQNVAEIRANGRDAGYRVTMQGFYQINNNVWDE